MAILKPHNMEVGCKTHLLKIKSKEIINNSKLWYYLKFGTNFTCLIFLCTLAQNIIFALCLLLHLPTDCYRTELVAVFVCDAAGCTHGIPYFLCHLFEPHSFLSRLCLLVGLFIMVSEG